MQPLFSTSTPSSTTSDITDASSSSSLNSGSSIFSLPEYPTTANELYVSSDMAILDLRPRDAFVVSHLRGSVNIPLSLTGGGLFSDATAVEGRWVEMRQAFEREDWTLAGDRKVLVLCEDEDSGRMATAMLRAKDIQATCVAGGYLALATDVEVSGACER
jgi:rhodanese-related sulfurtransferase